MKSLLDFGLLIEQKKQSKDGALGSGRWAWAIFHIFFDVLLTKQSIKVQ